MDPLSITTAAAAAAKALFIIANVFRGLKNATEVVDHSVEALENLSRGLAGVLEYLHQALKAPVLNDPDNADHWVRVRDSITSCEATIADFNTRLASLRTPGSNLAQQAWRAFRLELQQNEIARMLSNLTTHSLNLQLALQTVNVIITASVPSAVNVYQNPRFDRLERMLIALRPHIDQADNLARLEAASDGVRVPNVDRIDDPARLEAANDGLGLVAIDRNTTRLYWSAASIVSRSPDNTIKSAATDVPVESSESQESPFEDFATTVRSDLLAIGSELGYSLDDEQREGIHDWLRHSPGNQVVKDGPLDESTKSDEDSDDDLDSNVAASLFKRGMECYAREEFGEARERLQRGIARAEPLTPEMKDKLKLPSMRFHYALSCIVQSNLSEAESSFLLLIEGSGSREEDARLRCYVHFHLATVQLKMGKLESAEKHCKRAVKCMKNEKTIGKIHSDYYKSLRLLALISWANGSMYDAQAYSDQLPESQQIPMNEFEQQLALVCESRSPKNVLGENASAHPGDYFAVKSTSRETSQTRKSQLSASRASTCLSPTSIDGTEEGTITPITNEGSTVGINTSASRSQSLTAKPNRASAAVQIFAMKKSRTKSKANEDILRAAREGQMNDLNVALQDPLANVDKPKSSILGHDETPLMAAASKGHYAICERLLEANATVNIMIKGWTALDVAIENGHTDVCQLLLQNDAKVDSVLNQEMSPLARAVHHGRLAICQLLVDSGADVNEPDFKNTKKQRTALMQAAKHNGVRAMTWLLAHQAKVDGPDPSFSTPLVEAARADAMQACRFLLEHNAEKQLKTGRGTAAREAVGWLKLFIQAWPDSSSWKPPFVEHAFLRDPLGVIKQN